jgi:hypothetical protein
MNRIWPPRTTEAAKGQRHATAKKFRLIRTPSVRNKKAAGDHCGIPHATWLFPLG